MGIKISELGALTSVASNDTIPIVDVSAGTLQKATVANIVALAAGGTGATVKTAAAKTGSGTTVTNKIAAGTTMDNAIGTLLNNDYKLNSDLTAKVGNFTSGNYKAVTGLAYDSTNKKLGLKVGADSVIPFSGGLDLSYLKSYILNTGYADYFVESTSADTTLETGGYETKRNSNTPVIIFMHYQNGYYYWMMYGLTENSVKVTAIGDYGTALYSTTTSQVNENETIYVAMQASGQRSRGYFNMTNPTKKVSIYPYYTDFVKTIADLLLHIQ